MRSIYYFFILFLVYFLGMFISFSQENNSKSSSDWIVTADIGFATLQAKDNFKTNATIEGVFLGREFIVGNNSSIITGLGFENARADFRNESNQQLFLKNSHINVPVSLRLFYERSERISLFADFGIYGSYLLISKGEILLADFEDSVNGLGFNFGMQGAFGAKYKFNNEKYSMTFGIKTKNDLISSYKSSVQEFKIMDAYFFQIGLGLIL